MTNEQYSALYAKQHAAYERSAYPVFLRACRKQVQPVIDWLNQFDTPPPLDLLVIPSVWRDPMVEVYDRIGVLAARREYYFMRNTEEKGVLDFLVAKWRQTFHDYAINYAYKIENELTETSKSAIQNALEEGYVQGLNGDRLATLIRRSVYNVISRARSVTISRTETTTASNLGKEIGAREWLGEDNGYQQWIGREDERERHAHFTLNDQIIPVGDNWNVGGELATMPGDTKLSGGQRINCRCTRLFMSTRRYNRLQQNNIL